MRRGERLALVLVLALALGFRLAVHAEMGALPRDFAPVVDSEAYLVQALRVAAGAPMVDGVTFQAPLYPWLLGHWLSLWGDPGALGIQRATELPPAHLNSALALGRQLNLLLGVLLVLSLYATGRALFGPAAGLWAAAMAAVSSPLVFYEGHLLKVSLSVLFVPWAVLAATRALRLCRPRAWIWVGVLLGLGGLVRGNMYLLAWLAAAAVLIARWKAPLNLRAGLGLRAAAWIVAGALLAMAPVVIRNSLVAGRPVLATAAGGTAFFLCNHAGNDTGLVQHTSLNRQVPLHEAGDWQVQAEQALGRPASPAEVSRYWMDRALDDIREDPGRWLSLLTRKLGLLFSRYEAPDNVLVLLGEEELALLGNSPSRWSTVMPLALAGALLALWARAAGGAGWALALALLGYGGSLLMFNLTSRFRMPIEPLAMLLAGLALARLPRVLAAPFRQRALLVLAVLLGLLAGRASEGPLGPLDARELAGHRAVRILNRALIKRQAGELQASREDLLRAVEIVSAVGQGSPAIFTELGVLDRADAFDARSAGDLQEAEAAAGRAQAWARRALSISAQHGPALRLLGLLHYDQGQHAEAVPLLSAAVELVPMDQDGRQYLCLSLLSAARGVEALAQARTLAKHWPANDSSAGLLALALLAVGDELGARAAVVDYDQRVAERQALGLPRHLPDQPAFARLRTLP